MASNPQIKREDLTLQSQADQANEWAKISPHRLSCKPNPPNFKPHSDSSLNVEMNAAPTHHRICYYHPQEELVSVCTASNCRHRGAICPQCQVRYHTEHLGQTWNLQDYLRQVQIQVLESHPGLFELNDFFIEFKNKIRNIKKQIIEQIDRIDLSVDTMIVKAKESFDKDIDDVKTTLKTLEACKKGPEFIQKVTLITQYFGIDAETHEVYRSKAYGELYKWKTTDLLMGQMEFFDQQVIIVQKELSAVAFSFNSFQIPQIDGIVEERKFKPTNIQVSQTNEMAHSNWIRGVQMFQLSDLEIQNMQLNCKRDQDGLQAIVTNSDDMEVKIWVQSSEQKKFKVVCSIKQAHQREFLAMRVQYCDDKQISRMSAGRVLCNNIIFTGEHGLIKVWDWVQQRCLNEIKTYSIFTYDFEVLRFPTIGLAFAQGSKNIIQVSDFTSPGGMLKIKEIYPQEQNKEISSFKKIPTGPVDILITAFGGSSGILKVYNHQGTCIARILRPDKELVFCLEQLMSLKRSQREKISDVLVVGSDGGIISAYNINDGKTLWINPHLHNSWIRGLTSLVVKDSYQFKSLVLSNSENEKGIKIIDGSTGQFMYEIKDIFDGGLRFRSLTCFQGKLDPKLPDSTVIVGGTIQGTLVILKIIDDE